MVFVAMKQRTEPLQGALFFFVFSPRAKKEREREREREIDRETGDFP